MSAPNVIPVNGPTQNFRPQTQIVFKTPVVKDSTGTVVDFTTGTWTFSHAFWPTTPNILCSGNGMDPAQLTGNADGTISVLIPSGLSETNMSLSQAVHIIEGANAAHTTPARLCTTQFSLTLP